MRRCKNYLVLDMQSQNNEYLPSPSTNLYSEKSCGFVILIFKAMILQISFVVILGRTGSVLVNRDPFNSLGTTTFNTHLNSAIGSRDHYKKNLVKKYDEKISLREIESFRNL